MDEPNNLQSNQGLLNNNKSKNSRTAIYFCFLFVSIFSNYDTGVVPAATQQIQKELNLSFTQLATLGTLVNLGIGISCIFVSSVFQRFQIKNVLIIALIINTGTCVTFALSMNLVALYISRFLMGLTQAFWVVYGPIWINKFAPQQYQGTWLGIIQGFSPLGIVIGFASTSIIVLLNPSIYSWRYSVVIQGIGQIIPLFYFFFADNKDIDILRADLDNNNNESKETNVSLQDIKSLLKNEFYILGTICICAVFFVVYGIQFWGNRYLLQVIGYQQGIAQIIFVFISITAPAFGVVLSGIILDKMGGYQRLNMINAVNLATIFSMITIIMSIPAMTILNQVIFVPSFWIIIFTGALLIPPAFGFVLASVEEKLLPASQSISQVIYNIFGYFVSPIFSGLIMDLFQDKKQGLIWGLIFLLAGESIFRFFQQLLYSSQYQFSDIQVFVKRTLLYFWINHNSFLIKGQTKSHYLFLVKGNKVNPFEINQIFTQLIMNLDNKKLEQNKGQNFLKDFKSNLNYYCSFLENTQIMASQVLQSENLIDDQQIQEQIQYSQKFYEDIIKQIQILKNESTMLKNTK